jgi:hypothetical protein
MDARDESSLLGDVGSYLRTNGQSRGCRKHASKIGGLGYFPSPEPSECRIETLDRANKASLQNCQPFNESSDKGQSTKTQPTDFFVLQSLPPHLSYPVPFKMSGAAQASSTTTKATTDDKKQEDTMKDQQKPNMALEEDDEFEDFPVEGKDSARVFTFAGCFRKALC